MRKSMRLPCIAIIAVCGCSDPAAVSKPDEDSPALHETGFTANVHGSTWIATRVAARRLSGDVIEITGSGTNAGGPMSLTLRIASATGTGTHSLAATGDGSSLLIGDTSLGPELRWSTRFFSGDGAVTITGLTTGFISGVFSGNAEPENGAQETLYVTDGRFNVAF